MKKISLCLTAVICFSLLNVARADETSQCANLYATYQYSDALPFCQKSCDLDYGVGCGALGLLYANGFGVRQDYQQAKTFFEKACSLNDGVGCFGLGELYRNGHGVRQDYQQAKTYYEKACGLNLGLGCNNVGALYDTGNGGRLDYQQAKTYYEKACSLSFGQSCNSLGIFYHNGKGVRQNFQTAKEYFGKACDLGDQDGCDNYRMLNEKGYQAFSATLNGSRNRRKTHESVCCFRHINHQGITVLSLLASRGIKRSVLNELSGHRLRSSLWCFIP